ncbi:hypothetical protein SARC_10824 [Sphaeroforma arctica JP610]|uniref:Uncharacterized protein n=1 Tax=Sphaeroforma arctica JP610 TaxID=667725 RepID=A0A0L0FIT1_9EUKA|nr:hypothetical protein SARC_10824 [Sphaeroforma arctica JP610]KNC76687.1 hypothetical protein SARC_10824 [Sphaeroforma arctica JP610]|eukprot:XP_014150589.1 hypothetical protein SARC_10824 [Sphaeroforma arctica JP610]
MPDTLSDKKTAELELAALDNPWVSKKPEKPIRWIMLSPIIWAGILPMARIVSGENRVLRNRVFAGCGVAALAHSYFLTLTNDGFH